MKKNLSSEDRASLIRDLVARVVAADSPLFESCCEYIVSRIATAALEAAAKEETARLKRLSITDVVAALGALAPRRKKKEQAPVNPACLSQDGQRDEGVAP